MSEGHPTPEKLRRAIVRAFHDEGLSYAQIAHLLGLGRNTLTRKIQELGIDGGRDDEAGV